MERRLNRALASHADILRALSRARFSSANGGGLRSPKTSVWDRILRELFKKKQGASRFSKSCHLKQKLGQSLKTTPCLNSVLQFYTVKILDKYIPRMGEGRCCKTGVVISSTIVIGLNGGGGGGGGGGGVIRIYLSNFKGWYRVGRGRFRDDF